VLTSSITTVTASEKSANIHQTTWRNIPEGCHLNLQKLLSSDERPKTWIPQDNPTAHFSHFRGVVLGVSVSLAAGIKRMTITKKSRP
jgi:hypothetical protein